MSGTDQSASAPVPTADDLLVVGLGASAGGITALRRFFSRVTPDGSTAYVVILHLAPDRDSHLAEVLQVVLPFPVTQVTENEPLEPDHVYVISPNRSLTLADGHLGVAEITRVEQRRSPVDVFFRTLASAHGANAVSVILSGTGANGSAGIKAIKAHGGLSIAQDPAEAEYTDMPGNAIATGCVDLVLRVEDIPARIVAYRDHLKRVGAEPGAVLQDDSAALREVLTLLKSRTGNDFSSYKPATILRRIHRRMTVANVPTLVRYAGWLREHPDEAAALMKDLLISVTHFFRDPEAFAVLQQRVVPRLFDGKGPNDQVRVWVPACATGEEAYSIAMLLVEHLDSVTEPPPVQLFASDLDEAAIATARYGLYSNGDIVDIPQERLDRFFHREASGYRIRRELREMILFAHHNLVRNPPFSHLDLISCRNLLIYVNRAAQDRIVETFHFALRPGGYLLLGPSESPDGSNELFLPFDRTHHFYQSRPVGSRLVLPELPGMTALRLPRPADPRPPERFAPLDVHHRLLEEYAPPSLVVTDDYTIVHMSPRVVRFLQMGAGEPSRDLIRLLRPELRADVRTALYQSATQRVSVEVKNVPVQLEGASRRVDIVVRPELRDDDPARGFFLVLFSDHDGGDMPDLVRPLDPSSVPISQQLEEELARVKAQLRTTIEQYEAQVEEAQASSEEQQATNEELRSSAEELETSKEELQSVNEELSTVNQELKIKVEELRLSNSDFQNLINSTDIATIFLDRSLRVKLTTPRARDLFNLLHSDVGRPLSDITNRLRYNQIDRDMHEVLVELHGIDREVQAVDGRWYVMRIRPYRTVDDRIDGVVLMFQDVTARRDAELSGATSEERLRLLIDSALDYAIFTMDDSGRIDSWNAGAERVFGYSADEIIGHSFDCLFTAEDRAAGAPLEELDKVRQGGRALDERSHVRRDGTVFHGSSVTTRLGDRDGLGFAKIARDLTHQEDAAQGVTDAHAALEVRVGERTRELAAEVQSHQTSQLHVVNLLRKVVTAQEDERGRIARNLHDQLGQRLTALRLSLERLQDATAGRPRAEDELAKIMTLVQSIDSEVSFLAWELRPAVLDHLGLAVALPRYVHEWAEHYGIEVKYQGDAFEPDAMSREAEIALYRIAQEALTNVAKHAHANRVDVLLESRDGAVTLVIEDDGVGFEPENTNFRERGIGLVGMRERAGLIGAEFELEASAGEGTSVFVRYMPPPAAGAPA